jgi:signal transduction histidine kinase
VAHITAMTDMAVERPLVATSPIDHRVLFYENEHFLAASVADFLADGLRGEQPVIVIATAPHRHSFALRLRAKGFDVDSATAAGRLAMLDAEELLATFMVGLTPNAEQFNRIVGGMINGSVLAGRVLAGRGAGVRMYGEMVDVLWGAGNTDGAIRLEQLWNELGEQLAFSLLCAYPLGRFYHESHTRAFQEICRHHSDVLPTEQYVDADEAARRVEITVLQQRARALETEIEHREQLEKRLREALVERQTAEEAVRASERDLRVALESEQRTRAEVEAANQAKAQFLAAMSHELRTPLNAIAGYTDLLDLEVQGPVTAEQREYLTRIRTSQQYLLSLINDVLNFARLEAGRVELRVGPVAIDRILRQLEPLIAPQVAEKQLSYTYIPADPAWLVQADADKVQQVMLNLLTNAIKYTECGGRIVLSVRLGTEKNGPESLEIEVRDTGIGIPTDRLVAIFEPFVQVSRRLDRKHEGVGLGTRIDIHAQASAGARNRALSCSWRDRIPSERAGGAAASAAPRDQRLGYRREVLARIDELILLDGMLAPVEVPIAPAQRDQFRMRATLQDLPVFEHENLVGAPNRGQPVGDDERRASPAQAAESGANLGLALAVEAGRRLI